VEFPVFGRRTPKLRRARTDRRVLGGSTGQRPTLRAAGRQAEGDGERHQKHDLGKNGPRVAAVVGQVAYGETQGQTAMLHPVEALLDERPDEEVGWGLHGSARLNSGAEQRNLIWSLQGLGQSNTICPSRSSQALPRLTFGVILPTN